MKRLNLGHQDSTPCQEFLTRLSAVGIDVAALDLRACARAHDAKLLSASQSLPLRHRPRLCDDVADSVGYLRFTHRHT